MPLRRNRRQYEQLTDFDRGRSQRSRLVENKQGCSVLATNNRRGGSGRPRNTNDREDRAIRRVATSAPTTSLASIQRHLPPLPDIQCHQEKP
ncbi:hypothetical protein TNCV_786111 [Trichonephila clavipes]|nr:hypothetical protein TNCV_786111 [Trichonephila clavipes]